MLLNRLRVASSLFVVSLLVPASLFAAQASEVLTTPDSVSVTRADFLKASIRMMNITLKNNVQLQYRRPVPVSLQPYVKTGLAYKALPFGNELNLAQKITRGQAIYMLVQFAGLTPVRPYTASYKDVGTDAVLKNAIQVALEQQWFAPESATSFGVDMSLNGKDARALLDAAVFSALPEAKPSSSSSSSARPTGRRSTSSVPTITVTVTKPQNVLPDQEMLQAVWQLLTNQYLYNQKLDAKEAAYKAAEGIVESLNDPYTMFLRPAPAQEFKDQIGGQVTGIGAQVEYKDNILTIVAPIAGSPAEKAGLKPGDKILEADGLNITNIGFLESVSKVRGPKGTSVKLHIDRGGEKIDIVVMRDTIKLPEIDVSFQGSIAVVRLSQFGETTDRELRGMLEDVADQNPTGLILDLRNNPGGLLHAADIVVSNFLPKGSVVAHIVSRSGDTPEKTRDEPTINSNVPVVVLVNKGSASAAEITAGALQDAKRATVVGEQTFGKGTVQQILQFRDGSELKMTIAEWETPLRRKINGVGVKPDYIVPANDARDDQMAKALELLR